MADHARRLPANVCGPYYVDDDCIDCDTCRCIAPAHFRRDDAAGYSYVYRQPADDDEEDEVEEARDCCPVGAIGRQPGA